MDLVTQIQGFF